MMNTIQLIGPGAAGKTTLGKALALRLDCRFFDLDQEFIRQMGDISAFIDKHGYAAYAKQNVCLYLQMATRKSSRRCIIALSSGFMTYPKDSHPAYPDIHGEITGNPCTLVLLPSLNLDVCVAETVRRQLLRPFARSPAREEEVIRSRFSLYANLPAKRIETLGPIEETVNSALALLNENPVLD